MASLQKKQKEKVLEVFLFAETEEEFQAKLKPLGLSGQEYEESIADLIFAIATNKPVPKSNG